MTFDRMTVVELAGLLLLIALAWIVRQKRPSRAQASSHEAVEIVDPERMNLLGLLLTSLLERRLDEPSSARHARKLRGDVLVAASGMQAVLRFDAGRVRVLRAPAERPVARIEGSLAALLDAALGRRRGENVMRGNLRARGRPVALWHLLRLISPTVRP